MPKEEEKLEEDPRSPDQIPKFGQKSEKTSKMEKDILEAESQPENFWVDPQEMCDEDINSENDINSGDILLQPQDQMDMWIIDEDFQ